MDHPERFLVDLIENNNGAVVADAPLEFTGSTLLVGMIEYFGYIVTSLGGSRYQIGHGRRQPPVNVTLPVISGTIVQGQQLSVNTGTWLNSPTSYSYQWRRAGAAIGGATANTYTLVSADVGTIIGVTVTARNSAGSASVTVSETDVIQTPGPVSSAGVFDSTGALVRTIWSAETNHPNVSNPALTWNGALDDGSVAPTGSYTLKVVRHNITYNWDITNGAIGNSSTGPWGTAASLNIWNPGSGFYQFAITAAGQIWVQLGYNEKYSNLAISSRNNIQSMTYFTQAGVLGMVSPVNQQREVVTDDTRVYVNIYIGGASGCGVYAIDIATNLLVTAGSFSSTISIYSCAGFDNSADQFISGMAVQRTGSYLFLARRTLGGGTILTLNKTSGATAHTNVTWAHPSCMACNPTNATELWVVTDDQTVIRKLAVDGAGNITATGTTISYPNGNAVAIDISPDGARLLVAGGYYASNGNVGDNQVTAYHTSNGSIDTTWGNSGKFGLLYGNSSGLFGSGSTANPTTVSNTTFHFSNQSAFGQTSPAFISYDPADGSFWIGDNGNYRALHFTSGNNPTFIEAIYARGGFYDCFGCMNDPTKVMSNWKVYTQDVSKSLQYGNGSWALSNNLGGDDSFLYDQFIGGRFFIKGSNGRYYFSIASGVGDRFIFEMPGNDPKRVTGVSIDNNTYVDHDFNLWMRDSITPNGSTSCTIRRNAFTGFDGSNNPTWTMPTEPNTAWPVYLTFTPPASFPLTGGDNNFYWPGEVLSNGVIPMFDPSQNSHNHLGGIDSVTGQVKFSTMPLTPSNYGTLTTTDIYIFPEAPFFDFHSGSPGGQLFARAGENHFFTQFRGEQTNGGQTNVISHWHETGLVLNRFGAAAPIFGMAGQTNPNGTTPPGGLTNYKGMSGLTGNSAWGGAEKDTNTGIWYLYEGDEWYQGGITRWSIDNINTIVVNQFPISWDAASYPANVDPTDLLYGLPYNSTVVDGVAGWHRSPAVDIPGPGDIFLCKTNVNNCSRTSPSLSLFFNMNTAGLTGQTYRDIPRVLAGNWQINAVTAIYLSNLLGNRYVYTEVIDNAGKVLVRLWEDLQGGGPSFTGTLLVNGSPITPYVDSNDAQAIAADRVPLTIAGNVGTGMITVTWSKHNYTITVSPLDVGGNVAAPAKFQYNYHQGIGAGSGGIQALFSLHYTET